MKLPEQQMTEINKRVLAVILNYNTYDLTLQLIRELRENIYIGMPIMVVDNCSTNQSSEILKNNADKLNYIFYANEVNAGYAAGNNIGIRYAIENGYDYTWILNNDLILRDTHILQKLVSSADIQKDIGCIGPKIYCPDGSVVFPYYERPSFWSMTFGIMRAKSRRKTHAESSGKVYCLFGCCMLLKNSVMEQINCMDESTFLYCEEDILSERMLKIGKYAYYCADTSITHNESSTVNKEHGKKSSKTKKIMMKSYDIYLSNYRHFNFFSRFLCKSVRWLILSIRG